MTARNAELLLITGAGASRNLGRGEALMPLMSDWADALCDALDSSERDLADGCGLSRGLSGEKFEENLGLLLRWERTRWLDERFEKLGGQPIGSVYQHVSNARSIATKRLDVVREILRASLYDEFGLDRIDEDKGVRAYGDLLSALGNPSLIAATTNYDCSLEVALSDLDHRVNTGFNPRPHRTPIFSPEGMLAESAETTPVLHLHGAVGWYESGGEVHDYQGDKRYNKTLGNPVVLYPDPDKDPTSDKIVSQIWSEFRRGLANVEAVLVVGHSLHDPALVRALNEVAPNKPVAITHLPSDSDGAHRIDTQVQAAIPVAFEFGLARSENALSLKKIRSILALPKTTS